MIELTTGIAFLLSSMYGAGASTTDIAQGTAVTPAPADETTPATDMTDRKNLEKYLREHYADTPILLEIARCESTLTHYDKEGNVVRGRVNSADVGVMQINEKYHLEASARLGLDIHTVEGNVAYAKHLYETYGASPWSASSPCWGKTLNGGQIAKN